MMSVTRPADAGLTDSRDFLLPQPKMTNERFVILAFLFGATFLNYLDRVTLSVTKGDIQQDIGATETQMGFLFSAFAWSITAVVLIFGWLMQRYGSRKIGAVGLTGFSIMTALTATASSLPGLAVFRFGLGIFEAPTFPLNSTLVRSWFPRSRRAKAVSVYMIGSFFGLAFAVPLLGQVQRVFGSWQSVFVFAGVLGLIFSSLWWWRVRDTPELSERVSAAELELIRSESEPPTVLNPPKPNGQDWRSVLFERRLLGLYIGAFATSSVVFFFLTWFPDYLKTELGFDFKKGSAVLAALPYIFGMFGMMFSGWLSDHLVKLGKNPGQARKVTVTIGLSGVISIVVVPFLDKGSNGLILAVLCVTLFFAGMANTAWLLCSEMAKPRLLGITTGVYGFWVNLFGAATPLVVGIILDATGKSYGAVFAYVGGAALVGALSYLFLVDAVAPMPDKRFPDGVA